MPEYTEVIHPKTGRPPKRAKEGTSTTLTVRIPAEIKNQMIDRAQEYDLTVTEYLISLVQRDE
tara:strand:- start:180 stop:368 length:189 start_codon:yes stop_codon:yes gene_type:complete